MRRRSLLDTVGGAAEVFGDVGIMHRVGRLLRDGPDPAPRFGSVVADPIPDLRRFQRGTGGAWLRFDDCASSPAIPTSPAARPLTTSHAETDQPCNEHHHCHNPQGVDCEPEASEKQRQQ